jgi:hypothetical protein
MGGDRRQAHRREPIEVVMDDGRVFEARPLPWLDRNALGALIVQQTLADLNEMVRVYVDPETTAPQLDLEFSEKLKDPIPVLRLIYPDREVGDFTDLTRDEITELLLAGVDVNGLERIRHLVDPNSQTPMLNGGIASLAAGMNPEIETGQKTASSTDSSLPESVEIQS